MDECASCNATNAQRAETASDNLFFAFNCAVLTFTLLLGLPGNLWVCWVVFRTKSLRTFNNALLVSLAASDLLKCSVDTPLFLLSLLRRVTVPVCALQQFTYALCSCVQLLTLVSISVERFQAIAFPFQTERRKARVRLWILSIWVCGFILAGVSLALSREALCRPYVRELGEERLPYLDLFGPYVLVPVWGLSLMVIVIHYVRIFKVVRRHRRKVVSRGVRPRPVVSAAIWSMLSDSPAASQTAPPRPSGSLPSGVTGSPLPPRRPVLFVAAAGAASGGSSPRDTPRRRSAIVGAVCFLTPGAKERGKKRMEGKLAQRFGYIIIAFTLSWVPMVVILLMNAIWKDTDRLLMQLETSATVLTCVQAAVDPLIYTLVTRQFRSELGKILSSIPGCPPKSCRCNP
ncbi:D(4) dopamine receptor-like [Takifugu flavidus]|uniref:D(4) dopamine receptor-like n=1 Tax=Takifugu flavidus TaxID=433684 RepID=UPI002544C3C6|nr:D(4) dopamine receptor-like [Takifugu flavidus]